MAIRMLHIADLHLDAPFRWLGNKGIRQRLQLKETFRTVVDLATAERVDGLLVAGDLFDSNHPSQDSIDLVRSQLTRLSVPVFLLPGTHDCYDETSVYRRLFTPDLLPPNVFIFDGQRTAIQIDSLGLTVHAKANRTKTGRASPLDGLHRNAATPFNVALAHGSLSIRGSEDDFPITSADLRAVDMDYVALGHWHSCRDCSSEDATAYYAGPAELLAENEQGCALLVELRDGTASVERRTVGARRFERREIGLEHIDTVEDIRNILRSKADGNLVLSVLMKGLRPLEMVIDRVALAEEFADSFFWLRLEDISHPMLSPEDIEGIPSELVLGYFVRRVHSLIKQAATADERRVREAALQLGIALLQGKKVL